jgi:hypothetical protein
MKRVITLFFVCVLTASVTHAAEITFNPSTQFYDLNSEGVLSLWGVPEANGNAIRANPDGGWPQESIVMGWYATILKAQQMNLNVPIGYDPVTFDIWYVARPR